MDTQDDEVAFGYRVLTIPNIISIIRLAGVPLFLWLILVPEADAWALIDYMKAQGAGQSLRALGSWPQPIGLPDMAVRCGAQAPRLLASWRGQRSVAPRRRGSGTSRAGSCCPAIASTRCSTGGAPCSS